MSRRAVTAMAAVCAVAALGAACGTPSADLFVVERSGSLPGARLHLVVGDGGEVECDGETSAITSAQLIEARDILRDLEPLLAEGVRLPPGPQSLLRFRVTGEEGRAEFSDSSPGLRPVFARILRFTRAVAREACGKPR